jgi:uncharacterized protein YutE (UPF0331/DUF86 family)
MLTAKRLWKGQWHNMTAPAKQQIINKLENLDEYIGYLDKLKKITKNDRKKFLSDFQIFGSAERYLQLSIQAMIDAMQMIIIEKGFKKPDENQETVSLLYNEKVISEKLAGRLDGIVGFRNILVHEYGKIDKAKIYKYLQEEIGDFKDFRKEIIKYLKKRG